MRFFLALMLIVFGISVGFFVGQKFFVSPDQLYAYPVQSGILALVAFVLAICGFALASRRQGDRLRPLRLWIGLPILLLSSCTLTSGSVSVIDPWSRPPPPSVPNPGMVVPEPYVVVYDKGSLRAVPGYTRILSLREFPLGYCPGSGDHIAFLESDEVQMRCGLDITSINGLYTVTAASFTADGKSIAIGAPKISQTEHTNSLNCGAGAFSSNCLPGRSFVTISGKVPHSEFPVGTPISVDVRLNLDYPIQGREDGTFVYTMTPFHRSFFVMLVDEKKLAAAGAWDAYERGPESAASWRLLWTEESDFGGYKVVLSIFALSALLILWPPIRERN